MKSFILAIVLTMFLSALYAFQNIADITVRFVTFEQTFPQGIWEAALFCAGAILMWIFSLFAMMQSRGKYKKQLKEKDAQIKALEKEKKSLEETVASNAAFIAQVTEERKKNAAAEAVAEEPKADEQVKP